MGLLGLKIVIFMTIILSKYYLELIFMRTSISLRATIYLIVICLIGIILTGCGNFNLDNPNEISGDVFPADEVCRYGDIPILRKYSGFNASGFNSNWGKSNKDVDLGTNFRYLCGPYPTSLLTVSDIRNSNTKVQISYDARGNRIEGAHTIYLEYRALADKYETLKQFNEINKQFRKDFLLPVVSEVVKKALKQPLSAKLIEKIQSGENENGSLRPVSCEKVGSGFVCIDNVGNERSKFAEVYICSNEEALKSNL